MKVIILLYGNLRTFRETIQNTLSVFDKHPELELEWYVHTWTQIEHSDKCWWNESLEKNSVEYITNYTESPAYKEWESIKELYPQLNIKTFIIEDYKTEKDTKRLDIGINPNPPISSAFYSLNKLAFHLSEYPNNTPIIRIRPDSSFDNTNLTDMVKSILESPSQLFSHTVGHGVDGYCCDIFYITSVQVIKMLSSNRVREYVLSLDHAMPETRFRSALNLIGVYVKFFDCYLYLLRTTGTLYYYNHNNPKKK
jgi:hypothetical protein